MAKPGPKGFHWDRELLRRLYEDDDRANNDPANLEVFATNALHLAETLRGKVPNWTPEGRARTLAGARKPRRLKASQTSSAPSGQQ